MDFDTILILGPQGSGKSTQGKRLAEKLDFFFWEMGKIVRETLAGGGPLAEKLAPSAQGTLLSDETIIEVAKSRLAAIPSSRGVIFDGLPRRTSQAHFLIDFLRGQNRKKPVSLLIDLSREDSYARLTRRAAMEKRPDDTPEAIAERLRAYYEAIGPVIEYLKKETRFITIDGRPSIEEIAGDIDAKLGLPDA